MNDIYSRAHEAVFWTLVIGCVMLSVCALLCWIADICERSSDTLDFKPRPPKD